MPKPQAVFLLDSYAYDLIYGPEERSDLAARVDLPGPALTKAIYDSSSGGWPGVEMIFSGWGMVPCDAAFLQRFPDLRIVFYGAGSIRYFVTDTFWDRGVRVTSATFANGVPVAEYTLSQILFGLKQGWQKAFYVRRHRSYPTRSSPPAGAYKSVVGLLSLGMIGRMVAERLRTFDIQVLAYDPFVDEAEAKRLGVEKVSLEEIFRRSDVVSCHIPSLPETKGMLQAAHFASMKPGATFLNTGRGAVVDEEGMIGVLQARPDLMAVLDVTHPEPPATGSLLYTLENVVVTPHIAGAMGHECRRMGQQMISELDLYLRGEPLRHEISRERARFLA